MKFWLKMIILSVALIALGSPTLHVCRVTWIKMTGVSEAAAEKVPSLNWEDLQQLDIRTGKMPASLKKTGRYGSPYSRIHHPFGR